MTNGIKIEIVGKDKVVARLKRFGNNAPANVATALYQEAQALIAEAKQITPVDTGALRASGMIQMPTLQGKQVEVRCGFGGPAAPYAVYVHENLEAHHQPPTQAKFLEVPAKRRAKGMQQRVADSISRMVNNASG